MWNTWTWIFGYPVQGICPPATTGYAVNYTCRSNNQKVIVTGDDLSLVKLFACSSIVEHAPFKDYGEHSSHIPKIRFTHDDKYLISVGGNDKCAFVWETDFKNLGNSQEEKSGNKDDEEEEEEEEEEEKEEKRVKEVRKPKNEREISRVT